MFTMTHGAYCARSHHINCGHCHDSHHSIAQVRVCGTQRYTIPETGETVDAWPCDWLLNYIDDEGETRERECWHPSWLTGRGNTCAAGHEHVRAEFRAAEGWDYASPDEAYALAAAGTMPVGMDGKPYIL